MCRLRHKLVATRGRNTVGINLPRLLSGWLMVSITGQHSAIWSHEFRSPFHAFRNGDQMCGDQRGESHYFILEWKSCFTCIQFPLSTYYPWAGHANTNRRIEYVGMTNYCFSLSTMSRLIATLVRHLLYRYVRLNVCKLRWSVFRCGSGWTICDAGW